MSERGGSQLRVVIADDNEDQRFLLRHLLADAGITDVIEAVDGDDAVRAAVEHRPDLVVLDLAMPVRSGLEVLPDLHEQVPDAHVVILSNFPRERVADAAHRRGAVGYVEKRVDPDRLVADILAAAAFVERLTQRISTRFEADVTAARQARQKVREVLDAADETLLGDVELLVSELVTNAVVHASSAPTLDIHLAADRVRLEVHDDDPTLPQRRVPDVDAPGGRGLLLMDRLASRWGAERRDDGKVVWFELDRVPG